MDAALSVERLIEAVSECLTKRDFEGAENLLLSALGASVDQDILVHIQVGRLYRDWNKLSSAITHLNQAAELMAQSSSPLLKVQVADEYRRTRELQEQQKP